MTETTDAPARSFTSAGLVAGARAATVLLPGVVMFGLSFGVVAGQKGLTIAEAIIMSGLVCAGTAQFAAMQSWTDPAPIAAAALASFALNARYILLGAAARPWFAGLGPGASYGSMFYLSDGSWAVAAKAQAAGDRDAGTLLGASLMLCVVWTAVTAIGHASGTLISDAGRYGLDFVLVAFFATLAVGFFRGRGDIAVVLAAIAVGIATDRLLPGPWYMITGALAGSAVAALRPTAEEAAP